MIPRRHAPAVILSLLLLGACSGGGDKRSERAAKAIPADPTAAKARAEQLTLQASDLPSGWTLVPDEEPEGQNEPRDKEFKTCLGLDPADRPEASSTFSKGDARASSEINLASSADVAANELALFAAEKAAECVEEALTAVFKSLAPTEAARVTVGRLKLPAYAESSVAYRAVARVGGGSDAGATAVYADLVAIRQGRVQASVSFSNVDSPLSEDLEKSLLEKLAKRMAR